MAPRPPGARPTLLELRRAQPPVSATAAATPSSSKLPSPPPRAALDLCRSIWAAQTRRDIASSTWPRVAGPSQSALPSWAESLHRHRPWLATVAKTSQARPLTTSAILAAHGGSGVLDLAPLRSSDHHVELRRGAPPTTAAPRATSARRARTTRGLDAGFFDSKARITRTEADKGQVRDHGLERLQSAGGVEELDQEPLEQNSGPLLPWYETLDQERLAEALFATTTSALCSSADLRTLSRQLVDLCGASHGETTALHMEEASWLVVTAVSKAPQGGPSGTSDHASRLATLQRLYLETLRDDFYDSAQRKPRTLEKLKRGALHAFAALRLSAAEHEDGAAALHHVRLAAELISDERLKPSQARYLFRRLVALLVEKERGVSHGAIATAEGEGRGRKDAGRKADKSAWEAVTAAAIRMLEQGALTKGGGSTRELSLAAVASAHGPATWAVEDQQKDRGLLLLSSALVDRGHSQLFLRFARAAQACLTHTHARSQMARVSAAADDNDDLVLRSPSGLFRLRSTPELSDPPPFLSPRGIERLVSRLIKQGCQRAGLELVYILPDTARTIGMYARLLSRWGETDPRPLCEGGEGDVVEGQAQLAMLLRQADVEHVLGPGQAWGIRSRRRFSTKALPRAASTSIMDPPPTMGAGSHQSTEEPPLMSVSQRISERVWADVLALLERDSSAPAPAPCEGKRQPLLTLFEARFTSHARHRTPPLIEADLEEMERLGLVKPSQDAAHTIASLSHKAQTSAVRCFADAGLLGKAMEVARACLARSREQGAPEMAPPSTKAGRIKADPAVAQRQHATRLLNVLLRAALRNTNPRSQPQILSRRRAGRFSRRRTRLTHHGAVPDKAAHMGVKDSTSVSSPRTLLFRRHHARRLGILTKRLALRFRSAEASTLAKERLPFAPATVLAHLPSSLLHRLNGLQALAKQFGISADAATLNMVLPFVLRSAAAAAAQRQVDSGASGDVSASRPRALELPSRRHLLHTALRDPASLVEALHLTDVLPSWELEPLPLPWQDFERRVRPLLRHYVRKAFERGEAREARRAVGILHDERERMREAMERLAEQRGKVKGHGL